MEIVDMAGDPVESPAACTCGGCTCGAECNSCACDDLDLTVCWTKIGTYVGSATGATAAGNTLTAWL